VAPPFAAAAVPQVLRNERFGELLAFPPTIPWRKTEQISTKLILCRIYGRNGQ